MKKSDLLARSNVIILTAAIILFTQIVAATPNSINIQGKLTNPSGAFITGTYNFTFRIYDNYTSGALLYETNVTASTDARGVYDIVLANINLPFNSQYYLAVKINNDSEMQPRVNLTSVPYSFKANESESLNASRDSTINNNINLSSSGNIQAAGTITGNTLQATVQLDVGGGFSAGGLTIQQNGNIVTQGDVLFSGNVTVVNVTYLSVNGSLIPAFDNLFDIGNASFRWRNANFSGIVAADIIDGLNVRVRGNDVQAEGSAYKLANFTSHLSSVNDSISLWNISGANIYPKFISGSVGIGTITPLKTLHVNGSGPSGGFIVTNETVPSDSVSDPIFSINTSSGKIGIYNRNPSATMMSFGPGNLPLGARLLLYDGSPYFAGFGIDVPSSNGFAMMAHNSGFISFGKTGSTVSTITSDYTEFARIANSGFMGVGTGAPKAALSATNMSIGSTYSGTNAPPLNGAIIEGSVGIGTTAPDNLLTVLGNELTANAILHLNASDNFNKSVINLITLDHTLKNPVNSTGGVGVGILFRASNNASQMISIANITAVLYNATNGTELSALTFGTTNGTERMRIDGSGNVGIGTVSPGAVLDVAGGIDLSTNNVPFRQKRAAGAMTTVFQVDNGDNLAIGSGNIFPVIYFTTNLGQAFEMRSSTSLPEFALLNTANNFISAPGSLTLRTTANNGNIVLTTHGTGNVGIGTTSPATVLDVKGKANFTGNFSVGQTSNIFFVDNTSGNVGIGTTAPTSTLHVIGTGNFSGNLYAGSCTNQTSPLNQTCTDIAELFPVEINVKEGDVVCLKENGKAGLCNSSHDSKIIGVVSTNPAIIIEGGNIVLGSGSYSNDGKMPIALKGKVPVKADCNSGIKKGDLLVSASKKGHAMKLDLDTATWKQATGTILGKALEECASGEKMIMAWVG